MALGQRDRCAPQALRKAESALKARMHPSVRGVLGNKGILLYEDMLKAVDMLLAVSTSVGVGYDAGAMRWGGGLRGVPVAPSIPDPRAFVAAVRSCSVALVARGLSGPCRQGYMPSCRRPWGGRVCQGRLGRRRSVLDSVCPD